MKTFAFDFTYLIILAGVVILFLCLREFNCWYWKINHRLALLEEIAARLERLESLPQPPAAARPAAARQFPEIKID